MFENQDLDGHSKKNLRPKWNQFLIILIVILVNFLHNIIYFHFLN